MATRGFSKVSDKLLDEDDEREECMAKAFARFKEAWQAFETRTKRDDEILRLFEEAEALIKPWLEGGLSGLSNEELATVLKGRLHQCVLISYRPSFPEKWGRVKQLAEQVLSYDHQNYHAHLLRGLALEHGDRRHREGQESVRQAAEYARLQGRQDDLIRLQQGFDEQGEPRAAGRPGVQGPACAEEALEELEEVEEPDELEEPEEPEEADEEPAPEGAGAVPEPAPAKASAPRASTCGMRKGFFNRPSGKARGDAGAGASSGLVQERPAEAAGGAGIASAAVAVAATVKEPGEASARAAARVEEAEAERARLEEELRVLRRQLEEVQEIGQEDADRARRAEDQLEEWQHELCEQLAGLGEELDAEAAKTDAPDPAEDAGRGAEAARAAAAALQEQLEGSRKWSEGGQQRLLDLSTEVATVREMAAKELRERREASGKQMTEVRELTGRVGELRTVAKTLREQARRQASAEEQRREAEKDVRLLADRVADFHALPFPTKFAAMVDDGTVLSFAALFFILGLLLMIGIVAEGFGPGRCKLFCEKQEG